MESEMQTEGIYGFKELNLSYFIAKTILFTIYTHYDNFLLLPKPYIATQNIQACGQGRRVKRRS